eukprot:jgi/Psemu1/21377/gm1.21377_g
MPPVIKTSLLFYCRGCWDKKGKESKEFLGYKSISNGNLKYVSTGLRKHLWHRDTCRDFYHDQGLIKRKIYNFSTSIKVQPTLPSVQHSLSDFGMTMTQNGPSVPPSHLSQHHTVTSQSATGLHSVLNRQIVHDVFLPPMDRNAIESYLAVSAVQDEDAFPLNNDIANSDDEDDNDDDVNENNDNNSTNNIDCGDNKEDHTNGSDVNVATAQPAPPPPSFHEIINLNEREDTFQSHTKLPPPNHLLAELELMNLMARHKLPLNTFKSIFQWAKKSQMRPGFDFCDAKIRSRKTIFDNLQSNLGLSDMKFHPHILNWLPDNKPTQVYVCSFKDAIYSLLSDQQLMIEENLSFPNYSTPLSPDNNPELNPHSVISELHHGSWWKSSWKEICNPNSQEILVPIIFYMDGISLDAHGRLTLTPLNMTLAWTTIYFHPDPEWESTRHSCPATSKEKIQNLHNGLEVAFRSFKAACNEDGGIEWNYLPYANQQWKVKMKFAIAYVIGDTELHDKLCGKYGSFNKGNWSPVDFHWFSRDTSKRYQ